MQKPAPTDHAIHELLSERWSPCAFSPEALTDPEIASLFEAARWAASCYNEQPWGFLVATSAQPEEHARLASCIVPANREWAATAPLIGIALASLNFAKNDKPNRHAYYDTGAAMAQLAVQATALGLRVHQMGGFDADLARETYAIPETWDAVAAFAVGRPGDPADLTEALRGRDEAPRTRKGLGEQVFAGKFGEAFRLS